MKKISPLQFLLAGFLFVIVLNLFLYWQRDVKTTDTNLEITETTAHNWVQVSDEDFVWGPSASSGQAKVNIVVYDDPVKRFAPEYFDNLQKIKEEFADDISITYRLINLDKNDTSTYVNSMLVCAGFQDVFYGMYGELMGASKDGRLGKGYPIGMSSIYPIDIEKFAACMKESEKDKYLDKWASEAEEHTIIGTPTTFINQKIYPGALQVEDFVDSAGYERDGLKSIVNQELKK